MTSRNFPTSRMYHFDNNQSVVVTIGYQVSLMSITERAIVYDSRESDSVLWFNGVLNELPPLLPLPLHAAARRRHCQLTSYSLSKRNTHLPIEINLSYIRRQRGGRTPL